MITYVELRYNSPLGQLALPSFVSTSFDMKYNDLGALEFTYPTTLADSMGLGDQSFISVHVGFGTGTPKQVEEYIIDQTSAGPVVDGVPTTTFAGPSILSILNDAQVYPSNWPGTLPGGHEFVEQTIGTIFRTLLLRARNRGTLTDLIDTSFTGTKDSSGADWTHIHTKTYENGTKYFAILQEMMEQGLVDVWMDPGLNLRIVNGGTRGTTVSIETVEIRPTKNISDLTIATQSGESASALLMEGEGGALVEVEDASFESAIGRRREHYVAQPGIGLGFEDLLTVLGEKSLETTARIPAEETVGIANTEDLTPFQDFNVGDWIYVRYTTDEPAQPRRVRQLAVSVSDQGEISLGATLGTILHEADVALARKLEAYTGSGGTILNNGTLDNTVPNAPNTLGITSVAYTTPSGTTQSSFLATWTAPTTNTGGDAYTDQGGFFVNWRYTTDAAWRGETRTEDNKIIVSGLLPGKTVEVSVVAVDSTNHRSAAAKSTHVLAADATPPPQPAPPTAASRMGSVQVFWSGLTSTGAAQPSDFLLAELHEVASPASVPVPNGSTRVGIFVGGSSITLTDLAYNTTKYYKVISTDRSGNWSAASTASTGVTVKALVNTDLIGEIIAGANLLPNTVTMKNLAIGDFENLAIEFDQASNRAQYPAPTGYTWLNELAGSYGVLQAAPTSGAANHHMLLGSPVPVTQGDEFWMRVELLRSATANYNVNVGIRALNATGAVVNFPSGDLGLTITPATTTTSYLTFTKALKVPVGTGITHIVPEIYLNTLGTTPTGTYGIRKFTIRRRNEGNLIVDGTITGSHIQSLTIATGHLAANSVTSMKVAASAITAEKIHLSAKGFGVNDNSSMEEDAKDALGVSLNRPAYWSTQVYASDGVLGYETVSPIAGVKSAKVSVPAGSGARLYYVPPNGDYIPVTPGEKWFISARIKRVGGGAFSGGSFNTAVVGCTSVPGASNPYPLGGAGEHWGQQVAVLDNGTHYTLTSVFTIPAGHTRLGMLAFLPAHVGDTNWVIDDFVAHPAIDDSKVTDITPGRITSGAIGANTRIWAGSETGARAELNAGGIAAYNAAGAPTFTVSGSTGAVWMSGTFTTVAGSGAGRVEIAAVQNPYQLDQTWNTIRFFSNNANWTPGMMWAAYKDADPADTTPTNWGSLELAGPKLGTRKPARIALRSEEQTNETEIHMSANKIYANAENYYWGDASSGTTSFWLTYAGAGVDQRFNFLSPGGKRVQFRYEVPGMNVIASLDDATTLTGMSHRARDFRWEIQGASTDLFLWAATSSSNRPSLFGVGLNAGIVFGQDDVHIKTPNGSDYRNLIALNLAASSDMTLKENIQEAQRSLEVIESVPVHTYNMLDNTEEVHVGLMAQELLPYFPEAVRTDEEGKMNVSLYALIAALWGAVQDLTAEVRDIQNPYSA